MPAASGEETQWNGYQVIARGANRICVRDRAAPARCLKFALPPGQRTAAGVRQTLRRWLARRIAWFSDNHAELRAYRSLRARLGTATDHRLAACIDLVDLPQGRALRSECVLLDDGMPAPSLYHCLFEDRRHEAEALCLAVDRFESWLLKNDIPLFDLNAGNFVVRPRDGIPELVCVDTKSVASGKEIIPFSRRSRTLMHRKVRRRAERLRQRIRLALSGPPALAVSPPPH